MEQMKDNIRKSFDQLTAGQKKVAKFVLEEPARIALHSAKEVGMWTGTSEATVIRFCIAIGYSGYSMLQEELRESLLHQRQIHNPIRKLGAVMADEPEDAAEYIAHAMRQNERDVEQTLAALDVGTLESVAERIRSAAHIVVIGLRASYAPAHWLTYSLNILRGNAVLYQGGIDDGNYLLSMLEPDWVVIALSFPRYMRETHEFVQEAKCRSAHIIAVTDNELSPVALLADQILKVRAPQPVTLKGMPAVFSLLNALTGYLTVKDRQRVEQRLEAYDSIGKRSHYFVDNAEEEEL